ncbi:ABC transporter substrate binding protein [Pseudogracilibacillus auburnensis]|uniref:Putative ABC transport system substrate-binding protein n=1 Tax=Pseudogracilibacillus auburnensis TaxID=1494959 RepID=A0A2V3VXI9_9BACI|nr:ABC transporter substrate-binding protein [Pseudogracilibacillus auburnensis]MBO1004685.1 ABC transporter substrate-binding protein [Pseudogracilibacillus auburnensis]PXW85591.1 putative ABC transport system substrate-binding protein [Pseudogracilibacillus auburnensis]
MKKWLQLLIIAAISVLVLAACGGGDSSSSDAEEPEDAGDTEESADEEEAEGGEKFVIGATQILEHPSLDAAYEGFQDAIADAGLDVEFNYQNAQNDQNNVKTISDNFVADNVDLIFANSTPSALGALNATNDIPILFTSVTDAVDAGLVDAMDKPGDNITGVVDLHPESIENTVEFIDKYFEGATVGLIYNAGEKNSVTQIEAVKAAAEGTSLTISERTVANSSEVQQAATTLAGDVDVFYIITDNTVVSALDSVVGVANDQQIPLIVGEPDSLEKGGFATFGIDYHTIGYRTGEMAVEVLKGEKTTAEIDVEYPPAMQLFINKEAAEAQGVEWNDDWDNDAQFLGEE